MQMGMIVVFVIFLGVTISADDGQNIIDQKKDLENIKQDVETSQRRLDSLRQTQLNIQSQIAEFDQKLNSDKKVIRRLDGQRRSLKNEVNATEAELAERSTDFSRAQRRYLGDIRQTFFSLKRQQKLFGADPNQELLRNRQAFYVAALAGFTSENVVTASRMVDSSAASLEGLSSQYREVNKLKHQKEVSYALGKTQKGKQEKTLSRVRRKSQDEAERVMNLKMAAAEMEEIIARLEEERELALRARPGKNEVSVFAGLKGQLRPPVAGKVVERFGEIVDPVTHLRSFSPGISIKGRVGAAVKLVAAGTVAYSGNLRGYGNFVIINHDNQYYTTYAGLGEIVVNKGQHLLSGVKLAKVGEDGLVRFELRRGREPIDPITWINFEAL